MKYIPSFQFILQLSQWRHYKWPSKVYGSYKYRIFAVASRNNVADSDLQAEAFELQKL